MKPNVATSLARTIVAGLLVLLASTAIAQRSSRDDARSITDPRVEHCNYAFPETGERVPYALFVPKAYQSGKPSPLIVLLHGGNPGNAGYGSMRSYDGLRSEADVMNVLALVRMELDIGPSRIYLFGHSMGGAGAYHLASRHSAIRASIAVAHEYVEVPGGDHASFIARDSGNIGRVFEFFDDLVKAVPAESDSRTSNPRRSNDSETH